MKLPSLRANERRLFVIVAVILGVWALLSWGIQPLWNRVADLRLEAESKTERLAALTRLMQEAPAVDQEFQAVASYLSQEDGKQAHQAFLTELETLSRDSGLQLSLKPKAAAKSETNQSKFEVELEVQGSQAQLLQFLDALLALPRLIAIDRMRIASMPSGQQAVRASLVIQGIIPSKVPQ